MQRRTFLASALALPMRASRAAATLDLAAIERMRVLKAADKYLGEAPVTVTAAGSPRSAGGKHDFFSEGDYWWPDPANPKGPYIQRDGMTNPDNFVEHRRAMIRLSLAVPALAAAHKITKERKYAEHAAAHLRAWFVDESTRMNPNLQYAQAIQGRFTGRGTGIIDTLHLVEVARAAWQIDMKPADLVGVKGWFASYIEWMTTHPYGIAERDAKNNHGTCWCTQVAAFAQLTGNREQMEWCRNRYKTVLIPNQEATDGSFPLELARTKPYGYSLFNLDAMAILVQTLSTREDNLWTWQLPDGRGMAKAMAWMVPFIADKKGWPKPPDVMYDKEWPVRQPCLVFAGVALDKPEYIALWKKLEADPTVEEVLRNLPVPSRCCGFERGRHTFPVGEDGVCPLFAPFCLLRLLVRVPVLAVERAMHHGEHHLYAALLLIGLQDRDDLGEGVQFDGVHLGFQFRLALDRFIDFFLALARRNGLGDGQAALRHLVMDRRGFLLRIVHGRLEVSLLVLTELERIGDAVEARASTAHIGHVGAAATRTTTAAALGKRQRRRQKSRQQNPSQHLLPPLASILAASTAARAAAHTAAGEHARHQIKSLRRFGLLVGLEQRIDLAEGLGLDARHGRVNGGV
ncbi:MAG: alginate lyase family protein, partial [Candidatus Solibacter sp.]